MLATILPPGLEPRVARVRAEYPNQLDYSGFWHTILFAGMKRPCKSTVAIAHRTLPAGSSPIRTPSISSPHGQRIPNCQNAPHRSKHASGGACSRMPLASAKALSLPFQKSATRT